MICRKCLHRKWITIKVMSCRYTIMGCTKKRLRFGTEYDMERGKADQERKIVPMPKKCNDYEEWLK